MTSRTGRRSLGEAAAFFFGNRRGMPEFGKLKSLTGK